MQVQAHMHEVPAEDWPVLYHPPDDHVQLYQPIQVLIGPACSI